MTTRSKNGHAKRKSTRVARDTGGRFTEGNPGGPGRPRRAIEREYLAMLSDAVPPTRWRKIINKVASRAERGDRWAVEWLAKYLLGEPAAASLTLTALATREALGIDAKREIDAEADAVTNPGIFDAFARKDSPTVLDRALKLERAAFRTIVGERIDAEPELQPYRDEICESPSWREYDYLEWVLTAPVSEIVAWAQDDPEAEGEDGEGDANG